MGILEIIVRYRGAFAEGLLVTLQLSVITWAVGLSVGVLVGVLSYRRPLLFGVGLQIVAFILASIPLLVMLYWVHYPLQVIIGVVVDPFYSAVGLLCLLNSVAVAEVCRAALENLPEEYTLAGRACGLPPNDIVKFIQLPLIVRGTLPSLLTIQVSMLQMTLFASLISVEEIFRVAQRINSEVFKPVEIYTALAIFFLMLTLPLNLIALWLRRRFTRDISER